MRYILVLLIVLAGCATSPQEKHDLLTQEINALQDERRSLINIEVLLKQKLQLEEGITKKLASYQKVRETHDEKGWPIATEFFLTTTADDLKAIQQIQAEIDAEIKRRHTERVKAAKQQMER